VALDWPDSNTAQNVKHQRGTSGIILNALKEEWPDEHHSNFGAFASGVVI
jgi:hypothetical protein